MVVMKGLISTSEASVSSAARASAIMNFTAPLMYLASSPSLKAILRAWKGCKPKPGTMCSLMMALGSFAATSSISMPPAAEAMNTRRPIGAVEHDAEIQFARDRQRLFDQQALHFLALGTGLVRDQLHAEHLGGELAGFFGRLGDLHAAAFAAASSVNLRFHDDAGGAIAETALGPRRARLRGSRPSARGAPPLRTSREWLFPGTRVFSCFYDDRGRIDPLLWPDGRTCLLLMRMA